MKEKSLIPNITIEHFSLLTNENHQEYVYRVYTYDSLMKDKLYHMLN